MRSYTCIVKLQGRPSYSANVIAKSLCTIICHCHWRNTYVFKSSMDRCMHCFCKSYAAENSFLLFFFKCMYMLLSQHNLRSVCHYPSTCYRRKVKGISSCIHIICEKWHKDKRYKKKFSIFVCIFIFNLILWWKSWYKLFWFTNKIN